MGNLQVPGMFLGAITGGGGKSVPPTASPGLWRAKWDCHLTGVRNQHSNGGFGHDICSPMIMANSHEDECKQKGVATKGEILCNHNKPQKADK